MHAREDVYAEGMEIITIPSAGGNQETIENSCNSFVGRYLEMFTDE